MVSTARGLAVIVITVGQLQMDGINLRMLGRIIRDGVDNNFSRSDIAVTRICIQCNPAPQIPFAIDLCQM